MATTTHWLPSLPPLPCLEPAVPNYVDDFLDFLACVADRECFWDADCFQLAQRILPCITYASLGFPALCADGPDAPVGLCWTRQGVYLCIWADCVSLTSAHTSQVLPANPVLINSLLDCMCSLQ